MSHQLVAQTEDPFASFHQLQCGTAFLSVSGTGSAVLV